MEINDFILYCGKLGIDLSDEQLDLLNRYYELLISWNEKINLTSITLKKDVYLKHFYDSLTICRVIDLTDVSTLCDVGTGAGFPGLVLKIVFPHLHVTLLDSLNKRVKFLNEVISSLSLSNIEVICVRAEEYALVNREVFDVVCARAVAKTQILLEYSIPMVKVNKYFIAYKGFSDVDLVSNALSKLDCSIDKLDEFELPFNSGKRCLIVFKKNFKTNNKYPRRFDKIKKNPL